MDDSGAILCHISSLKDMLDQVNEEIEANIQVTREIESEIVRCTEFEAALAAKESDLTKSLHLSNFDLNSLLSVANDSRKSVELLEEELCCLRNKREETLKRMNDKREQFTVKCVEFQREIDKAENDEVVKLLAERDFLENEISLLEQKNHSLQNSMVAFIEEVLQDLHESNSALDVEIRNGNHENEKLLKDIDDLKTTLLSSFHHC
ncbi:hypothetical protein Tsubulata_047353 [Turnera subulata]|uniref:Uncharacterized protein n=1 Tax=Turnera subulata TaxID=218843 RepID=A0A9Q0J952_9ROSI|nr:hypothetical protein Tsubulata_047353 [Turnera subulata]